MSKYSSFHVNEVLFDDCPPHCRLELSNRPLGVTGVEDILLNLRYDSVMKELNLASTIPISDVQSPSAMKKLMKSFHDCLIVNRSLVMLDLSNNDLFICAPNSHNEHITNYLVELTRILCESRIVKINLSGNQVTGVNGSLHKGLSAFSRNFLLGLARVFICTHSYLHSQSFAVVADGLGVYSSITYLDLSDNRGGLGSFGEANATGMRVLCTQLAQTLHLKVLRLARNSLRDDSFEYLGAAVAGMLNLQSLDLSGNLCHSAGMEALKDAIDCLCPCMAKG